MRIPVYKRLAGTGVLYFLAGMAGLAVPFTAGNVSPVWPASGVALACLLLFGWRCWPAIYLAAFLVNYLSHLPLLASLGLAGGNTAAALAGVFLLHRIPGFQSSLTRLRDMLGLMVLAALLSSTISASIGTAVLLSSSVKPWATETPLWLMYYLGDAMGILLAAPLLLSLRELVKLRSAARMLELAGLLLLTSLTSVLLFDDHLYFATRHTVLALLVFPFVLWAAIRFEVAGTALINAAIAAVALLATAHGMGPFSKDLPFTNALLLQLFFATLAVSGLLLSAVIAERKATEAEREYLIREQATQEAERESEKRYRQIVETANEGIWTLDAQGCTTFVNRQFAHMLGYVPKEMAGKSALEFCPETPHPSLLKVGTGEIRLRKKDGEKVWAKIATSPIPDEEQGTDGMVIMLTDITESKRAEELIRKRSAELQAVLDNSPVLIYMKDQASRYLFVNRRWTELFNIPSEFAKGKTDFELFPEAAARKFTDNDRAVVESGQTQEFEEQSLLPDGLHSYQSIKVALRDNNGQFQALCGISTDITERKAKEEALRQTHRAFRVLSQCNSAVVHATEEQALLNEICRIAVGPAGYLFAWVGYADNDEARTVRPVASAGPAEGFLDRIHVSWADNEYGRGSIGPAIRTGKPVVVRHLSDQPTFAHWFNELAPRNFESIMSVPLRKGDSVYGALAIYAREPDAFDTSEVALIAELGEDLAHGIASLRAQNERAEAIAALERARSELEDRVRLRTAELVEARDAAESADRLKSAFLAIMSHELRTPLNSIIGFTGIVLQGLAGPLNDEQEKQLGMVQNSSRHLLALINDVLDISKIEAGQLDVYCASFPMLPVLQKTVSAILPLAEKKGITVRTEFSPEVGEITSDQRRTEQILLNLLGNAVKFTDQGEVVVQCRRDKEWIVVTIRDTGIGIDPKHHESIFEPFRQADTGLARKREGTGLGLSICKRLVDLLGGFISVESVPDQGSTFTVRLPLVWDKTHEEHRSGD
jgi:PAS domain S-box-containing protein